MRILDGSQGTGASIRVLITSTDGVRSWTTVGASTNIIDASWTAMSDAVEYFLVTCNEVGGGETSPPPSDPVTLEGHFQADSQPSATYPEPG